MILSASPVLFSLLQMRLLLLTKCLLDTAKSYVDDAKTYVEDNKDDWQESGRGLLGNAKSFIEDSVDNAKSYVEDNKGDWLETAQANRDIARTRAVKAATKAQARADKAVAKLDGAKSKRANKKASKHADKLQQEAGLKLKQFVKHNLKVQLQTIYHNSNKLAKQIHQCHVPLVDNNHVLH